MKITQKEMAKFYGVSENTIVNWGKPSEQKKGDEIIKFFPPTGRHNLFRAAKLYATLSWQNEDGDSKIDFILSAIEELEEAQVLLSKEGSINAGKIEISYKDIGKQKLKNSLDVLLELKQDIETAESLKVF